MYPRTPQVHRDECEDFTDDSIVLAAWFNRTNLTFVTVSGALIDSSSRADDDIYIFELNQLPMTYVMCRTCTNREDQYCFL